MKSFFLLLVTALLLSACASAPQPLQYYVLDTGAAADDIVEGTADDIIEGTAGNIIEGTAGGPPEDQASNKTAADSGISIRLQGIKLARYLAQANMTLLRGDHSIYYASQHVWAEPLEQGFKRALARDLSESGGIQLLLEDEPAARPAQRELLLQIDNFTATEDSRALLVGKFWLFQKGELVVSRQFQFSRTLTDDGYLHAVQQQRALIAELAQSVRAAVAG
ncbi:MAG: membrane integrity-associated transporter subunit PqiC [Gammaproteobacteria bacterium]|uniref:PqiC family protein n=1 Tax=Pseudomaricurvus alcaniphilus TaxID=1166482 RepID=UPI00140D6492|nr:PqiC family protein [Pseudomaricurvus alcaniphilus]MBR9910861.1 membrane integrity-associated transporter subunit PqiC [Gammaproteobacteria bacterium]NHN37261.1 membrane integrity-associated transporter subunit PqiC [Pseudomaricurvus alcaniphilus]